MVGDVVLLHASNKQSAAEYILATAQLFDV
jgi:hypothetical protein